jgi:hypothetical protein
MLPLPWPWWALSGLWGGRVRSGVVLAEEERREADKGLEGERGWCLRASLRVLLLLFRRPALLKVPPGVRCRRETLAGKRHKMGSNRLLARSLLPLMLVFVWIYDCVCGVCMCVVCVCTCSVCVCNATCFCGPGARADSFAPRTQQALCKRKGGRNGQSSKSEEEEV